MPKPLPNNSQIFPPRGLPGLTRATKRVEGLGRGDVVAISQWSEAAQSAQRPRQPPMRKAPSLRSNNGALQVRVRLDGRDVIINRLGHQCPDIERLQGGDL